jgi:glucoamylase
MSDDDPGPDEDAPGKPGIPPTWTSSAKDAVGCALGPSRLWFTLGYGIVNEVYWPRVDIPQIRDLGFIVADGKGFWSEVKRGADYTIRFLAPGVPAIEVEHRHRRYRLRLRIAPDARRDVLAVEAALDGEPGLHLYALLAPHLGGTGNDNRAMVARHRGRTILWAEQGPFALALAAADERQRDAIRRGSAGYVGTSDGWQDFAQHGAMTWTYRAAGPGNVALIAELPRHVVLALGFASSREAAATLAISALLQPFDNLVQRQLAEWESWHARRSERSSVPLDLPEGVRWEFLVSSMVLRAHLDKTYPGAMVASLSVPWGDAGDERSGYHLVWPRDLVECAGGFLQLGAEPEARDTLRYLVATQHEDGRWYQNQYLGGTPYWTGVQLDEIGFPVLLAARLADRDALLGVEVREMTRRALSFIVRHGPQTDQDRWEENAGVNAFTLAVIIAALVGGAPFLDEPAQRWALDVADFWNAQIERWTVARGTELARRMGVEGYYVRTAPKSIFADPGSFRDPVPIRNRVGQELVPADEQVSTDFVQLVRFGLRRPDDPIVLDTLKVVDALLKVDTPAGPVWRRYNGDGYGEHEDGRPFDGIGRGRPWPLLTGERGHYEVAAGRDPLPYLEAMVAFASPGGMIPEQIWDEAAIPSRRLVFGSHTGSAMPLAWAHAEFVKLVASRALGHPCDRPRAVWERYGGRKRRLRRSFWWPHAPIGEFIAGTQLVVALPREGTVVAGRNGWQEKAEVAAAPTGLGFFAAPLDTMGMAVGETIDFTIRWADGEWLGRDYRVRVAALAG